MNRRHWTGLSGVFPDTDPVVIGGALKEWGPAWVGSCLLLAPQVLAETREACDGVPVACRRRGPNVRVDPQPTPRWHAGTSFAGLSMQVCPARVRMGHRAVPKL